MTIKNNVEMKCFKYVIFCTGSYDDVVNAKIYKKRLKSKDKNKFSVEH